MELGQGFAEAAPEFGSGWGLIDPFQYQYLGIVNTGAGDGFGDADELLLTY